MDIWTLLGIAPTTDISEIKQAYAARAKEWHPEEHPEEFKRLRAAYRQAVNLAKYYAEQGEIREDMRCPSGGQTPGSAAEESNEGETPGSAAEESDRSETPPQRDAEGAAFSYDDVSSVYQKDIYERFFREFGWIARNPYLQNRRAMWSFLLFQVEYEELCCHNGFRQRLVREICAVPGWQREILDYLEWWMSLCRETERQEVPVRGRAGCRGRGNKGSKSSRRWRWKKLFSRIPNPLPEHVVSREQRQKHYAILQTMRDRGLDNRLLTTASAEGYWSYYRDFLGSNEGWQEIQYKISCRKRMGYRVTVAAVLVLITVIFTLERGVKPLLNARREALLQEQSDAEEAVLREEQELRRQEEWQQELDERFERLDEQYQEWRGE